MELFLLGADMSIANTDIIAFQVDDFQTVAKKQDGTFLRSNDRPTMSFDYDILSFSSGIKSRTWQGSSYPLTDEQITEVETYVSSITIDQDLNDAMAQIHNSKKILAGTDWYVIREADTGVAMPDHIRQMRAQARALINEAQGSI